MQITKTVFASIALAAILLLLGEVFEKMSYSRSLAIISFTPFLQLFSQHIIFGFANFPHVHNYSVFSISLLVLGSLFISLFHKNE